MSEASVEVRAVPAQALDGLAQWLRRRGLASALTCRPLPWDALRSWRLTRGRLVHRSGLFFTVVGLRAAGVAFEAGSAEQPIILQPEVGILGFLLRSTGRGPELLVQAKAEPGNVGDVQLAPTVQATVSNYTRVHGGAPTPYLGWFTEREAGEVLSDGLQSEQGTRFLGKYNRNVVVAVPGAGPDPVSETWRWWGAEHVLALLARDYCVNTDARSVLVTTDWSRLCAGGAPFASWRGRGGFGEELLRSHAARGADRDVEQRLLAQLAALRARLRFESALVPLHALGGWRLDGTQIVDRDERSLRVRGFEVHAESREVTDWDQPLFESLGTGEVILLCQRRRGILRFLLRASVEVGFRECVQFGPSVQLDGSLARSAARAADPWYDLACSGDVARERSACTQSDEGGRFYRSIARYSVTEIDAGCAVPESEATCWATLGQVRRLLAHAGALTNEARSAFSMLLAWL